MDRNKPSGLLPRNPFARLLSTKLAVGVFCMIFLAGYSPTNHFPPLKKSIVHAQDTEQVKTVQAQSTTLSFQPPHPGYLSTPYSSYHPGIDLATGLGMPVHPIAKGKVISAGFNFWGLGLAVEIEHPEGYRSVYAHMGTIYVQNGQEVDQNNLLGEVGLTGNTTGPHTHLEVYKDGSAIDPSLILPPLRLQPQESDFIAIGGKVSYSQNQQTEQKKAEPEVKPEPKKPEVKLTLTAINTDPTIQQKAQSLLSTLSIK